MLHLAFNLEKSLFFQELPEKTAKMIASRIEIRGNQLLVICTDQSEAWKVRCATFAEVFRLVNRYKLAFTTIKYVWKGETGFTCSLIPIDRAGLKKSPYRWDKGRRS